jgi:hypothetical protein
VCCREQSDRAEFEHQMAPEALQLLLEVDQMVCAGGWVWLAHDGEDGVPAREGIDVLSRAAS